MFFSSHPSNMMFLSTIIFAFICIQLVTIESSEINDVNPNDQMNVFLQSELPSVNEDFSNSNSESDEENDNLRRATSFLRFGRGISSNSGSFLRFGRGMSPNSGSFLRFGRGNNHNGAAFLRFGRRALQLSPSNFHRFARKGEFLRFG